MHISTVNEKPVKANYRLLSDDVISVVHSGAKRAWISSLRRFHWIFCMRIRDVIVVNKPKADGCPSGSRPLYRYAGKRIVVSLRKDQLVRNQWWFKRPGIVHRIDMDTTGSLIVCKNDLAHQNALSEQLKRAFNSPDLYCNCTRQHKRRRRHRKRSDRPTSH